MSKPLLSKGLLARDAEGAHASRRVCLWEVAGLGGVLGQPGGASHPSLKGTQHSAAESSKGLAAGR